MFLIIYINIYIQNMFLSSWRETQTHRLNFGCFCVCINMYIFCPSVYEHLFRYVYIYLSPPSSSQHPPAATELGQRT